MESGTSAPQLRPLPLKQVTGDKTRLASRTRGATDARLEISFSPADDMADDSRPATTGDEDANRRFDHTPVMADEVVALVAPVPNGPFVDATLGGAGHAARLLETHPGLTLLGIDRDPVALEVAADRLAAHAARITLKRARFDQLGTILAEEGVGEVSGFLFDLGVSSPQLDWAERGFSYRNDGPLDMRMDPDGPVTAADLVNDLPHGELASLLRRNGDERFAGRIASAILARRPLFSTTELAEIVTTAIPAATRRTGGHPAKRTFQALRIAVNDELEILGPTLEDALDALAPGGRGLVLTYHSGEDRIVKDVFRRRSTVDIPPGIPVPATDEPEFTVLRPLARRPSDAEQEENRRAISARLRVIQRRTSESLQSPEPTMGKAA
jgi:16S rRNA (cytosine1402-N4)-methyltransferase